jgi:hypothetical protein
MKKFSWSFCLSLTAIFTFGQSTLVTPQFFGMHFGPGLTTSQWPMSTGFSSFRTWHATVFTGGNYVGVDWPQVNPAKGQFRWTELDGLVALAGSSGVDIVYTLTGGYSWSTPSWVVKDASGMPNLTDWRAFVTAITNRYNGSNGYGRIKYWEIWNEPNNECGSLSYTACGARMFPFGQAAYPIIKTANNTNMVLSPSPQGSSSASWLDAYFNAGGSAYTDIIAFHGYIGAPENIVTTTQGVKDLRTKYPALANAPIWDTEHSWGTPTWAFGANEDQQAAWVARFLPLSISSGIERSIWYQYAMWVSNPPGSQWGPLFAKTGVNTGYLRKPGIAYNQVYEWLNGASVDTCVKNGGVYSCRITRPGYEGLMVWSANSTAANPTATAAYTVPQQYNRYRTLDGTTVNIAGGSSLTLTMKPVLLEGPAAISSTTSWQSFPVSTQTGAFTATFDAVPNAANGDAMTFIQNGTATGYPSTACGILFNSTGKIQARNGAGWSSATTVNYVAGTSYRFRLEINVPAHTYSIYVTPSGQSEITLGTNYAFRTEQASVSQLTGWSLINTTGSSHTVRNMAFAPRVTSTTSWQSFPVSTQRGTFTASFDAVPNAANINAVTGIQNGTATGYTSQACQVRFNSNGTIDARNGGGYTATTVNYVAGTSYHFRLEINVPAHTYSIYVTPSGQSEITLGTNCAFRTEKASVSQLTGWSLNTTGSSHTVSNMAFTPSVTSTTSWQSFPVSTQTGTFTASFDAVSNAANSNAMTFIQNGTATGYTSTACGVLFNSTGQIQARNGAGWSSATTVNYVAGKSYRFRLVINVPAHTYSIYVTPSGQSEITLGTNYAFRTEQASVSQLTGWSLITTGSSHTVSNMAFTSGVTGVSSMRRMSALSTDEPSVLSGLKLVIYPNPGNSNMRIQTDFAQGKNSEIRIYNSLGHEVFSKKINSADETINVSNFRNGIYLLRLQSDDKSAVQKFIVQH